MSTDVKFVQLDLDVENHPLFCSHDAGGYIKT